MMSVLEYAEDVNKTVKEILNKCKELGIEASSEDDDLDEEAITLLDNAVFEEEESIEDEYEDELIEKSNTEIENMKPKKANQNLNANKNKEIEDYLKDDNIDMEIIIYNLMFYLGRYSIQEKLFPKEFSNNIKFPDELNKYKSIVKELYEILKNNSGKIEDYIEIKKLINYFKGAWVDNSSNI